MTSGDTPSYDAAVIGAGFFGIDVALELTRLGFRRVLLAEREPGIMRRASFVNQARIHHGYHYSRSLMTAERSRINYRRFVSDFAEAVPRPLHKIYAIARSSRVSGPQFEAFCRIVGLPCQPAARAMLGLFDASLVAGAFEVEELAFDASRLAGRQERALAQAGVDVRLGAQARVLAGDEDGIDLVVGGQRLRAAYVFNCTYADIASAGVTLQALVRRELAELLLVEMPNTLRQVGITVIDGPFFSVMPHPASSAHSLSHVRYTPHESYDHDAASGRPWKTNREAIMRDSTRYMPALAQSAVIGSMFDIKAILARNEGDDGRPILIERSAAWPRVISVLGSKIDNIYDVREFLHAQQWSLPA